MKYLFLKCTAENIKLGGGKRDFNLANITGKENKCIWKIHPCARGKQQPVAGYLGDALLCLLSPGAGWQPKGQGMAGEVQAEAGARQPTLGLHRGLDGTSRTSRVCQIQSGGISPSDCPQQTGSLSIPSLSITISHQFVNATSLPEGVFTLTVHTIFAL